MIIITNNVSVYETFNETVQIEFLENYKFLDVLIDCRDRIHKGAKLLTHPLTGSIKPNETPFKSIMMTEDIGALDVDSLTMIESSIEVTKKFLNNSEIKEWPERILADFRVIDFRLIKSALETIGI